MFVDSVVCCRFKVKVIDILVVYGGRRIFHS